MEEDIKILEEIKPLGLIKPSDLDFVTNTRYSQALDNLIKGYRELKECLEATSKSLNNIAYDQIPIAIQDLKVSSIPKSKIKEKIDELNTIINNLDNDSHTVNYIKPEYEYKIQVLQELMEDK